MEDIKPEDIDKFRKEKEEQQKEFNYLEKQIKKYKKQIKAGTFSLEIKWEKDIKKIDLGQLKRQFTDEIRNNLAQDYIIIPLNLNKVVEGHCDNPNKIFSPNKLCGVREKENIARLIEFIESGNQIIPPMIQSNGNKKYNISIIDGNHRIGLCRFLGLNEIPFIIKKDDSDILNGNYK